MTSLRKKVFELRDRIQDPLMTNLEEVLNSCPHCVFIKASEGTILYSNTEYDRRLVGDSVAAGRHGKDFLGKDLARASYYSDKLIVGSCSWIEFEHLGLVWRATDPNRVLAKLRTIKLSLAGVCNPAMTILGVSQILRENASDVEQRRRTLKAYFNAFKEMESSMQRSVVLLGTGNSVTRVAEELGMTRRTVENHKRQIFKRFEIDNVIELAQLVCRLQDAGLGDFGVFPIE